MHHKAELHPAQTQPQDNAETPTLNWGWLLAAFVTLLVGVGPAVWNPGGTAWMVDEPAITVNALLHNHNGSVAPCGLAGSFPLPYGPVPTNFYQLLLLITEDPIKVVAIRALLVSGTIAGSLLWLSRTLRYTPWFAAAVVASPYLWHYSRILWDASLALPLGMLAMAAYAAFLKKDSTAALFTAILATALLPFIHLMNLPMVAAIFGHLILKRRHCLRRHRAGLVILALILAVLFAPYFLSATVKLVIAAASGYGFSGRLAHGHPIKTPLSEAMLAIFIGNRLISAESLNRWIELPWMSKSQAEMLQWTSYLMIPLAWVGMIVVGTQLARAFGRKRSGVQATNNCSTLSEVRTEFFRVASLGMAVLFVYHALLRVPTLSQYFFGTFPLHVVFAWAGVEALRKVRIGLALVAVQGIACAIATMSIVVEVQRRGWDKWSMGPTLGSQVEVAKELSRFSDREVYSDVGLYQYSDIPIRALRAFFPPVSNAPVSGRLLIRYRTDPQVPGAEVELVEMLPQDVPPPGARRIEIVPLPIAY